MNESIYIKILDCDKDIFLKLCIYLGELGYRTSDNRKLLNLKEDFLLYQFFWKSSYIRLYTETKILYFLTTIIPLYTEISMEEFIKKLENIKGFFGDRNLEDFYDQFKNYLYEWNEE